MKAYSKDLRERVIRAVAARAAAEALTVEAIEQQMAASNSIRRVVDAREVAHVVTFLCSPKSIAINGDVIAAGGGIPRSIYY